MKSVQEEMKVHFDGRAWSAVSETSFVAMKVKINISEYINLCWLSNEFC